jgi:bacteriocin-like protein
MATKSDKSKLSKDELKKVSGGTVFRAKVSSITKVRNKPGVGTTVPKSRSRGRV